MWVQLKVILRDFIFYLRGISEAYDEGNGSEVGFSEKLNSLEFIRIKEIYEFFQKGYIV